MYLHCILLYMVSARCFLVTTWFNINMETVIIKTASLSLSNTLYTYEASRVSSLQYCNLLWNFFALLTTVYFAKRLRGIWYIYDLICIFMPNSSYSLWFIVLYTLLFIGSIVKIAETANTIGNNWLYYDVCYV